VPARQAAWSRRSRDKFEATYAIELVLDRFAEKNGISHTVIAKAVEGYVEDMLGDVFFEVEEELQRERHKAPDIC
jgi:hypothetical protein